MANEEQVQKLKEGVRAWNAWRKDNPDVEPELQGAELFKEDLTEIDLHGADLSEANLSFCSLIKANLRKAILEGAQLFHSHLEGADFEGADLEKANLWAAHLGMTNLRHANLMWANMMEADLRLVNLESACLDSADLTRACLAKANLTGADLQFATLTDTILDRADLSGAYVYGISAWNLSLEGTTQTNLTITYQNRTPGLMPIREPEPVVTADNILIAQFLYLLLNNENIRQIIDTITSKAVLILGRFSAERKTILDAIRDALRQMNYLPVMFDFNAPTSRDFTETIRTLAHLARFIVVDLTEARSVPQELQAIVPHLAVPVQPLLLASEHEYAMFSDLKRKYHWVLETHRYNEHESLLVTLRESLIQRAEQKAQELADGMQKGR